MKEKLNITEKCLSIYDLIPIKEKKRNAMIMILRVFHNK